jgi:hypothetical protein
VAIDDEDEVGAIGHFAGYPQVSGNDLERDVGTHRHDVDVHEAAGAFLIVSQYLLQAIVIELVERLQDLLCYRLRQVGQQVREVIDFHALGRGDELFGLHALDEAVAHVIADFDENVAFVLGSNHFPKNGTLAQRQRLE